MGSEIPGVLNCVDSAVGLAVVWVLRVGAGGTFVLQEGVVGVYWFVGSFFRMVGRELVVSLFLCIVF